MNNKDEIDNSLREPGATNRMLGGCAIVMFAVGLVFFLGTLAWILSR